LRRAGFQHFRIFTSVRDANCAFLGSRAIRREGRYDMTAGRPVLARAWGRAVQLAELGIELADPDAGEDLVGLAQK